MPTRRRRLLLHAGTMKTGTTTLQCALHAAREPLLAHGILYPDVEISTGTSPKHQWMVNDLVTGHVPAFDEKIVRVAEEAERRDVGRVILSTEGIYNNWFAYPDDARAAIARMLDRFDVTVWLVVREPVSWAVSMYVQALKNPPIPHAPVYATAESLDSAIHAPWFATRLRYADFVRDAERTFGRGSVHVMRYESGDILDQARAFLGIDDRALPSTGEQNRTLTTLGVDLLRRLNAVPVRGEQRERAVEAIIALDRLLGSTAERLRASPEVRRTVLAITRESEAYLAERFGIGWSDVRATS